MKASDRIHQAIEAQISDGVLMPGDPVDEESLMTQFGVSRTPVREALLRLQTEGLVTPVSRGGHVVAKMDFAQIISVWELLADLEALCARYACLRMTDDERALLARVHQENAAIVTSGDDQAWGQANRRFHEVLYAGARNSYLRPEILRMRLRTAAYRSHAFAAVGHVPNAHEAHGRIVEAIQAKDAHQAAVAANDHLNPAKAIDVLRSLPRDRLA